MDNNIINLKINRPDCDLIRKFENLGTSDIDDATDRNRALSSKFIPFGKGKLCGPAYTIRLEKGDNLVLAAALDLAKPGDVLVIDGKEEVERALVGDLLATYACKKGIQGMVINGAVRDIKALNCMENFICYALAVSPNGPYKKAPGSINVPVDIQGKTINPGDLIISDEDGVIAISKEDIQSSLDKALAMKEREETLINMARNGINPRPVTAKMLEEVGCIINR